MSPDSIISTASDALLRLAATARQHGHFRLAGQLYEHANQIEWDAERIHKAGSPLAPEVNRQITNHTIERH